MTTITIPPEALEAAARAIAATDCPASLFDTCENYGGCMCRDKARAAALALLENWPGMFPTEMEEAAGVRRRIILPLTTQENENE